MAKYSGNKMEEDEVAWKATKVWVKDRRVESRSLNRLGVGAK